MERTDEHLKTERERFRPPAIVGGILLAGAFAAAGPAAADPATPTTPPPGQPVLEPAGGPIGPVAAPPMGPPTVPEIDNPTYGAGNTPGMRVQDATRATADSPDVVRSLPASRRRAQVTANPLHRKLPRP